MRPGATGISLTAHRLHPPEISMDAEEARRRLRGPYVPMTTPFEPDCSLDTEGFRALVRALLKGGIREGQGVLMAAVAAGEFPTMTMEERKEIARALSEEALGRVPLVISAQHTDPRQAIELCRYAEDLGIDAVQMGPTYHESSQTEDDVLRFYRHVADHTDIGFMIYNTYWKGFNHTPHIMPGLLEIKNVVSMKWAAPTEWQYREMLRFYGDRLAFMDNMNVHVWGHMHGTVGFLSHPGNFWPEHEVEVWRLLEEKRYEEANARLLKLNYPFYDLIHEVASSSGIVDANVTKAAVEMVGLPAGPSRPPARELTDRERFKLRELLVGAGVPMDRT